MPCESVKGFEFNLITRVNIIDRFLTCPVLHALLFDTNQKRIAKLRCSPCNRHYNVLQYAHSLLCYAFVTWERPWMK